MLFPRSELCTIQDGGDNNFLAQKRDSRRPAHSSFAFVRNLIRRLIRYKDSRATMPFKIGDRNFSDSPKEVNEP
jgi:hypothetical protein